MSVCKRQDQVEVNTEWGWLKKELKSHTGKQGKIPSMSFFIISKSMTDTKYYFNVHIGVSLYIIYIYLFKK